MDGKERVGRGEEWVQGAVEWKLLFLRKHVAEHFKEDTIGVVTKKIMFFQIHT